MCIWCSLCMCEFDVIYVCVWYHLYMCVCILWTA
jgi:hypothetical protein